jgi:hypothetical protein
LVDGIRRVVVVNVPGVFVLGLPLAQMVQRDTLDSYQDMVAETSMKDSLANDHEVVLSSVPPEGIDQGQHSIEPYLSSWMARDGEQESR